VRVFQNHHMDLLSSRRHGGYAGNAMRVLAIRVEDPDTHAAYVVIKEDLYRKLREAVPESDFTLHEFEDLIPFE
jgi:hypothetical protein